MNSLIAAFVVFALLAGAHGPAFAGVGVISAPDGSQVVYEDLGRGDTTLFFIHCLSCNRDYWKHQAKPFSKDYRVVLVDLPGHGEASVGRSIPNTPAKMAVHAMRVIRELDLKNIVLVGSSMGGPISLEIARRMPDRVLGVVGVDNLHNAEKRYPKEAFDQLVAQLQKNYDEGMRSFIPYMFPKNADPKLVNWVLAEALTSDPDVCIPLLRNLPGMDLRGALKKAGVPIRNINAAPYSRQSLKTSVATNRKYADFDAVEMEGVGHFPMLERPKEFNAHLRKAIQSIRQTESAK